MQVEGRIEVSGDRHSDVERKFTLILLLGFGVGFCDCHMHRLFLTPKIHRVLWFSESYNNKGGVGMYEGLELLVVMLNVDSRLRSLCYRIYLNFVSLFKTFHLGLRVMICFPMAKIDRRCECTQAILNFKIHQCQCKIVYSNPWILTLYPDRFPTEQEKVTSLFSRTDWLADILVIWGPRPKQTGKRRKIIWNFISWWIVGLMKDNWKLQNIYLVPSLRALDGCINEFLEKL